MPETYLTQLTHFTTFLTAYTHTLLYLRSLYPQSSFATSKFHNTPVHQSRHPLVCEWITDAIKAVREELLLGTVAKIGVVVFCYGSEEEDEWLGGDKGSVKIMERYMFDVSSFPVVPKADRLLDIEFEGSDTDPASEVEVPSRKKKGKMPALDKDVPVDMSEQFRAALVTLTMRSSQMIPLPKNCSFNISMELKDEADVDPPTRHPQPWIPVQPSLQKTGRKGREDMAEGRNREGGDLGGVKVTPIRSVEAGVFRFETWVEEGKAKFQEEILTQDSLASSIG
ncbi:DNA-binding protein [Lophiotrema nucula]|uniref:DNA-binding protein n=1 Tax=Lophiotrema nucula TaxID=690887 RepID=A0A6A5ZNA3_9PLEO|nr:DNA-binding protein [Lophiotrema nucula]